MISLMFQQNYKKYTYVLHSYYFLNTIEFHCGSDTWAQLVLNHSKYKFSWIQNFPEQVSFTERISVMWSPGYRGLPDVEGPTQAKGISLNLCSDM